MRYIVKPSTSFIVVINGPVATAGSIFIRFNANGISDPKTDAIVITINRESETA
jgi:hypothetical protein